MRVLRRRGDEAGFTLVEVVVAMTIFAVMVPATIGVIAKTLEGTRENRSRVVAAGLASAQLEKIRTTGAATPESFTADATRIGNVDYTLTQTVTPVTGKGAAVDCATITEANYYLQVAVSVKWTDKPGIQPARADTLLRATTTGTGALAVTVTGSAAQFVSGLPVTLSTGKTGLTSSSGCALFTNLAPGTYTAALNSSGYVGPGGTQSVTSPATPVVANQVAKVSMVYDRALTLAVTYTGAAGGPLGSADLDRIPSEFRTGTVSSSLRTGALALPGSATGLYPAAYTVRSGTGNVCTVASQDMTAGIPTTQTTGVPTARVGLSNLTTFAAIGDVVAIYQGPATGSGAVSCPIGTTVKIGTVFSIFGDHSAQLPLGKWRLQFPWNPIGFIPIPGLTVICSDISLSLTSVGQLLVDVGNLISAILGGLLSGGGCT